MLNKEVTLNLKISEYGNKVLGVVKETYGFKDKSQALNKLLDMYGDEFVDREIRDEIVKEMIASVNKMESQNKKPISVKEFNKFCGMEWMFNLVLSPELEELISKLEKKDKILLQALNKKVNQIISCDPELIDHYKNLRHSLSDYKRVHIDKSFVLLFKVNKDKNTVYFFKLEHHDIAYK